MEWFDVVMRSAGRDQEHWNSPGKYGLSSVGTCLEKRWFEILGKQTVNFSPIHENKKIFFIGTACHELIENYAVERYHAVKEFEVRYTAPTFTLKSNVDLVIPGVGVIDIKTIWSSVENYVETEAREQVNMGQGLLLDCSDYGKFEDFFWTHYGDLEKGGVLVVSLANPFTEFSKKDVAFFEHEFDHVLYNESLRKYAKLTECIKNKTPPNEFNTKLCKYCQYSMMCPKKVEDKDGVYDAYWKSFRRELDDAEIKRRDAVSDGLYTGEPVDKEWEGLELDFFKN